MSFWEHWSKLREDVEGGDQVATTGSGVRSPVSQGGCTLTRVIFPDMATSVVSTNTGESIRALVSRLLDKRNLKLTSFDVFLTAKDAKPLDLSEDCAILHCSEVKVETRILFRLELPSHKSIGVKASHNIELNIKFIMIVCVGQANQNSERSSCPHSAAVRLEYQ